MIGGIPQADFSSLMGVKPSPVFDIGKTDADAKVDSRNDASGRKSHAQQQAETRIEFYLVLEDEASTEEERTYACARLRRAQIEWPEEQKLRLCGCEDALAYAKMQPEERDAWRAEHGPALRQAIAEAEQAVALWESEAQRRAAERAQNLAQVSAQSLTSAQAVALVEARIAKMLLAVIAGKDEPLEVQHAARALFSVQSQQAQDAARGSTP
jgi:hypothetical protein